MSIVDSARISYGDQEPDEEKDRHLVDYMLDHEHGTPFEHNLFTIRVKAPILVFRQWHRTRIGVSYNEQSARYSEMADEFYEPTVWRAQAKGPKANKQGSVAADLDHALCSKILADNDRDAMARYRALLDAGVAKEMARMCLPVNLYSSMYFSCNARSLMYFIALRSDMHAQAETRQYSHAMAVFLMENMSWAWSAFAKSLQARKNRDYTELFAYIAPYELAQQEKKNATV